MPDWLQPAAWPYGHAEHKTLLPQKMVIVSLRFYLYICMEKQENQSGLSTGKQDTVSGCGLFYGCIPTFVWMS
jgi:hypothetical protein